MFQPYRLGNLELPNRFVFPPIKTGYGDLGGSITERQLDFYRRIATNGPGLVILEPVAVSPEGREHPRQMGIHLPESVVQIRKIVEAIHGQGRLAALHLNHGSLPEQPQWDALSWIRGKTDIPRIVAGRMGRRDRVERALNEGLADLVAEGRPLLSDPDLIRKWSEGKDDEILHCGYCLQGCLHRLKNGEPLGCNVNPELGLPERSPTPHPKTVLVAGGGPAGMSAALYARRRGHRVTLVERTDRLGGRFDMAWKAPGKAEMKPGLESFKRLVASSGVLLRLNTTLDESLVREVQPDLLVWAIGGGDQNIPKIPRLEDQYLVTSLHVFLGTAHVKAPRVLVIGAGRVGLEIAEMLGGRGYEVVATKRTDPLGSHMEMITRNLTLKRISGMPKVTLMPRTTVKGFYDGYVDLEQDGTPMSVEPFQTVIAASGLLPSTGPDDAIRRLVADVEVIGDASDIRDIFTAVHEGYRVAAKD